MAKHHLLHRRRGHAKVANVGCRLPATENHDSLARQLRPAIEMLRVERLGYVFYSRNSGIAGLVVETGAYRKGIALVLRFLAILRLVRDDMSASFATPDVGDPCGQLDVRPQVEA